MQYSILTRYAVDVMSKITFYNICCSWEDEKFTKKSLRLMIRTQLCHFGLRLQCLTVAFSYCAAHYSVNNSSQF